VQEEASQCEDFRELPDGSWMLVSDYSLDLCLETGGVVRWCLYIRLSVFLDKERRFAGGVVGNIKLFLLLPPSWRVIL